MGMVPRARDSGSTATETTDAHGGHPRSTGEDHSRKNPKEGDMTHRPGFTGQLTRAAARHPWRTFGLWVVLLVAAFAASGTMDLAANPSTAGTEATKAE